MFSKGIILIIKFYQKTFSCLKSPAYRCRYYPSCSQFTLEAVEKFGLKGIVLGFRRILSCHPWGGNGYYPVPEQWPGWKRVFSKLRG